MATLPVNPKLVAPVFSRSCVIRPWRVGSGGVTAGDTLYLNAIGRVARGNASAAPTAGFKGYALATKAEGEVVDVLEEGWLAGFDLDAIPFDAPVYLSNTAGATDGTTAGTVAVAIGRVAPTTERDPATGVPAKLLRVRAAV